MLAIGNKALVWREVNDLLVGMQPGRGRHSQANENDDIHPPYKRRALAPSGGRRRGGTIGQQRRKSGFHGVQFEHRSGLWLAEFRHHGKVRCL